MILMKSIQQIFIILIKNVIVSFGFVKMCDYFTAIFFLIISFQVFFNKGTQLILEEIPYL